MPTISFPTLRNTSQQVLYGFSRTVSCMTKVVVYNDGSEQRWPQRAPLYIFNLPMSSLLTADKNSVLSFFTNPQVLGQYGTTATITVAGTTYSDLTVESDSLAITTNAPVIYNTSVILRQVKPVNPLTYTPPTVGSSYPTIKCGYASSTASVEYPFTETSQFRTSNGDNPFGAQFNYPWYANGLTGFPTTSLRVWTLEYPLINDADLSTLETYFLGNQGRTTSFTFADPIDGTAYSHVRFLSDTMTIKYIAPGQNSTTLQLVQTNNS